MKILVLNAGSSSQKSCLYEVGDILPNLPNEPLWEAKVDWTRHEGVAEVKVNSNGEKLEQKKQTDSREAVIADMLETLWEGKTKVIDRPGDIDVVGHRVVHGGQEYRSATVVTPEVKAAIARLGELAPAHNPANLQGIESVENVLPDVPQVAVFDTAFHSDLPLAAAVYPLPYEWYDRGIRRYGFHGISYQYASQRTADILGKPLQTLRLIICHLGNGCSMAAVYNGRSVDTTMGFTPLEGLMMGSRSGSIDPGIPIHVMRSWDLNADELDNILNRGSGLKGVSGISGDMREIRSAIAQGHERAKLAFDIYVHRVRSHIGAMLASLGGLDALVFTGGVGEHHPPVRSAACETFGFLGLKLDPEKNENSPLDEDIAAPESRVRVLVLKAQEDWAIARECWRCMQQPDSSGKSRSLSYK